MRIPWALLGIVLVASPVVGCADDGAACGLEGASCEELASARARLTSEFGGLLEEERYDDLPPVSRCVQEAVALQFADDAQCGLTVCGEICRLHPCDPPGYEDCVLGCQEQSEALGLGQDALEAILHGAARAPELCTCDLCTEETFDFCVAMWGCMSG